MPQTAVNELLFLMDRAFEGSRPHSLLNNLGSVIKLGVLTVLTGGAGFLGNEQLNAAKVIVAHFGQLRHPEKQTKFGPELVRRLLRAYPNLHYDISTGFPGRRYACNDHVLDTAIWQEGFLGGQAGSLRPEYKAILAEFRTRFVAATDYGGGRKPLPEFLRERAANLRLILRELPGEAQHDIAYRNAWRLLTGKEWKP